MRFLLRYGADKRSLHAFRERQELVKAGLTRRDLVKLGVLTTGGVGGGLVFADKSLADGGSLGSLPNLEPFVQELRRLEVLPRRDAGFLNPTPTIGPNPDVLPDTGGIEGRHRTGGVGLRNCNSGDGALPANDVSRRARVRHGIE